MSLENIRVVLVGTVHGSNIKSCAKVMGNMGLHDLVLVSPVEWRPGDTQSGTQAAPILRSARVLSELGGAVDGCDLVVGFVASAENLPMRNLTDAAVTILEKASRGRVALLFGPECADLSGDHLSRCHDIVRIDATEEFPSLDLAATVGITCYELRQTRLRAAPDSPPAAGAAGRDRPDVRTGDRMPDSQKTDLADHSCVRDRTHRLYDPLLGYAYDFRTAPEDMRYIPGYDLWPVDMSSIAAKNRVMTLGGSTSDYWEDCRWPMHFAHFANAAGYPTIVFNGGSGGYGSHLESLKLYRDAPALRPTLVISLSGINDFWNWSYDRHPMLNPFQVHVAKYLGEQSSAFDGYTLGLPNPMTPAEFWLRNGRVMRFVAADCGAHFIQCLQPTMGSGPYEPTCAEAARLANMGEAYHRPLDAFYAICRAALGSEGHSQLVDLSSIFTGRSGLFLEDTRHANDEGNRIIAGCILDEVIARGWLRK